MVFAEPQFSVGERYVRSVAAEVGGEVRLLYSATPDIGHSHLCGHDAPQLSGAPGGLEMTGKPVRSAIEVRKLAAGYGQVPVINDVDWSLRPGALAAVIGPNGGGKSTLLKALVGLIRPMQGSGAGFWRESSPSAKEYRLSGSGRRGGLAVSHQCVGRGAAGPHAAPGPVGKADC